jgi:porin
LGFKKESGIRIGGVWIGDINYLITGGVEPHKSSGNTLFQIGLNIDLEKRFGWKGGMFGIEFLQFDGRPTNEQAGCVQGYNGLPEAPPLDRSELYQLWIRQELFDKKLVIRIGKSIPSFDFNNVIRPIPARESSLLIPAITSLIYTPIFINPTMLGVLPGYYNSAYGITINFVPVESYYISYGAYDGNLARGKQTGLRGPQFNGYYFNIAESGYSWHIGEPKLPGKIAIGVWYQSGKLTAGSKAPNVQQNGARGVYLFGSQRLWRRHPGVDNSGLIGFVQGGLNDDKTMQINKYFGTGLTFLGLVPHRLNDSFGFGLALSKLNHHLLARKKELLLQGYYQALLYKNIYFESALSYIPKPGAQKHLKSAWASTARIISVF